MNVLADLKNNDFWDILAYDRQKSGWSLRGTMDISIRAHRNKNHESLKLRNFFFGIHTKPALPWILGNNFKSSLPFFILIQHIHFKISARRQAFERLQTAGIDRIQFALKCPAVSSLEN